jgi:hypothetical protein
MKRMETEEEYFYYLEPTCADFHYIFNLAHVCAGKTLLHGRRKR